MSAQKSFRDSAMRYITPMSEEPVAESQLAAGKEPVNEAPLLIPMKPNPAYIETKSRRVQLLLQPTLHKKLKGMANAKGKSFNELVHSILAEHISRVK
jgi:hypothetical protein